MSIKNIDPDRLKEKLLLQEIEDLLERDPSKPKYENLINDPSRPRLTQNKN